jgi:DNA polymerase-3 subunit delta'
LPPTILSRCQRLIFPSPPISQTLPWLQEQLQTEATIDLTLLLRLTQGAPLAAIQWVQKGVLSVRLTLFQALYALAQQQAGPVQTAATLAEIDVLPFLDFMMAWVLDLLRLQWGGSINEIINIDFAQQLTELGRRQHRRHDTKFLTHLQQLRGQICTGANLNKKLLIENILVHYHSFLS